MQFLLEAQISENWESKWLSLFHELCALELKKLILIYLGASTNKW